MWLSVLNGAWPTQGTPSPPICVKPTVLRSIHTVMKWQPMPAMAREPSGTRVEVLCGQPEQNQGMRSALTSTTAMARSLAAITARRASRRAMMALSMPPSLRTRAAMALAISAGDRSALARSKVWPVGLGTDHSPPVASPGSSSNLPSTLGRTSARQLYSSSFSWYSMTWRFSSITRISCRPVANSRVDCASSGQTTPTLCRRRPMWRHTASSRPRSSSAWRVSL